MDIVSCDKCGVVLDRDKLNFHDLYDSYGCANELSIWNGESYVASASCPICNNRVPEE